MMIFDLVLATRRPQMTGVERYGVQLFLAMRRALPDVHAVVVDSSTFADKTNVHEVKDALTGWLNLPFTLNRMAPKDAMVICPSFPASPFFRLTSHRLLRVIHDAFPWTRGRTMPLQGRLMFQGLENLVLSRYTYLCAPTEQVTVELRQALKTSRVICCGNAPGLDLARTIEQPVERLAGQSYVLAVGTIEPRKNYEKFIGMANACTDKSLIFVAAGRPGWGNSAATLEQAEKSGDANLIWLRNTTDGQMLWLYRNSRSFVSASHAEGFNMPLVEAGMCGCAIVCSDIPIHRDVTAPWARLFSLEMLDSEAANLVQTAPRPATEADILTYRKRYGWDQVATRIREIIHG